MLEELSRAQAEEVLASETIGRLSCSRGGRTYVLAVTYDWSDPALLLVRTPAGASLRLDDERVSLEVDRVQGFSRWQTVTAWGTCRQTGDGTLRIRVASLRGFLHQKGAARPAASTAWTGAPPGAAGPARTREV